MADVVDLADRGRRHEGYEAFSRFMAVIIDSSDPDRAGEYIAAGICAWLVCHRGLSRDYLVGAVLAAIEDEAATPRA